MPESSFGGKFLLTCLGSDAVLGLFHILPLTCYLLNFSGLKSTWDHPLILCIHQHFHQQLKQSMYKDTVYFDSEFQGFHELLPHCFWAWDDILLMFFYFIVPHNNLLFLQLYMQLNIELQTQSSQIYIVFKEIHGKYLPINSIFKYKNIMNKHYASKVST